RDSLSDSLDINWWHWGFWASLSVVDFCLNFLPTSMNVENARLYVSLGKYLGRFIPYENVVFVSDKPQEIHWNNQDPKILHNDNGMSVKYKDGYGFYNLNGVLFD